MTSKGSESIPNAVSKQEFQGELTSADTVQSGDTEFPSPERSSRADDGSARQETGFDPTPYLRQLHGRGRAGGGDYLDVKWRLLWLRKEHPDAEIVTELVQHDPQMAIFKATVIVPSGGKATGYGSETASDFPDFIEKAETKAIGRALNALGYGAQFGESQPPEDPVPDRAPAQHGRQVAPAARPVALPRRDERPANFSRPGVSPPARPPRPLQMRSPPIKSWSIIPGAHSGHGRGNADSMDPGRSKI